MPLCLLKIQNLNIKWLLKFKNELYTNIEINETKIHCRSEMLLKQIKPTETEKKKIPYSIQNQ